MPLRHLILKYCREVHLYLGVFAAPALLFFAITGGLQTFSLHETTRGSSYVPPRWLAVAAQLHKKQNDNVPPSKLRPVPAAAKPPQADAPRSAPPKAPAKSPLPLKIFTVLIALSLALSTLTGLYLTWRYTRHARRMVAIFAAGIAVPVLLVLF